MTFSPPQGGVDYDVIQSIPPTNEMSMKIKIQEVGTYQRTKDTFVSSVLRECEKGRFALQNHIAHQRLSITFFNKC